jgi:hypothetical protein
MFIYIYAHIYSLMFEKNLTWVNSNHKSIHRTYTMIFVIFSAGNIDHNSFNTLFMGICYHREFKNLH